jgi:pimeloyl-ACP methyl ester carboxylesterase
MSKRRAWIGRTLRRALGVVALIGLPGLGLAVPAVAGDALPAPCRVGGLEHEVLCGSVARPLDPGEPTGRMIDVHYVVVPAAARQKHPDPVFFLAGGPGQGAIGLAAATYPLFARLNNRRDLVYIDQRGTGRSAPLACEPDAALPLVQRLDVAAAVVRASACRAQLQTLPHGDLRQFTTPIAMADADAVRAALGAPQVNLVGGSYGTRAALEYLRQFPQRVRRVVIDGVAPADMVLPASLALDAQAALAALFRACDSEAACAARHPRLAAHWAELLASLPRTVGVIDPVRGTTTDVVFTRAVVAAALRAPLYVPAYAAALPFAIDAALSDRFTPLLGLAVALGGGARGGEVALGMHFSVVCAEDFPRMDAAPLAGDFGEAMAAPYRQLCPDWPRGELPTSFYTLPVSPVPVLAFSGGLDPVTPPRHGARVVAALGAKARHVVVPNAGHGLLGVGCTRDLVHRFIDAEREADALAIDATCLERIPRPLAFDPPRAGGPR